MTLFICYSSLLPKIACQVLMSSWLLKYSFPLEYLGSNLAAYPVHLPLLSKTCSDENYNASISETTHCLHSKENRTRRPECWCRI